MNEYISFTQQLVHIRTLGRRYYCEGDLPALRKLSANIEAARAKAIVSQAPVPPVIVSVTT